MSAAFRIETDRLVMREFSLEDVDAMWELNSDPDVIQYTGDRSFTNRQEVIDLITGYDQYSKYKMGRWSMSLKATGEYIGWCGIKYLADLDETDLGFRLMKKFWDKGYATESSVAALSYGFDQLALKSILGRAAKDNIRSIRVLKKLGMVYEKDFFEHDRVCEQHRLTNEMWNKQKEILPGRNVNP
ncbi:MAG: GNAT family N-acetyltransferase [Bacteroidetes bacterium]|nr:GNAT family N-acetyltransferase [Bacteroidota bacterium]